MQKVRGIAGGVEEAEQALSTCAWSKLKASIMSASQDLEKAQTGDVPHGESADDKARVTPESMRRVDIGKYDHRYHAAYFLLRSVTSPMP
jgi:hypothetical protein